MMYSDIFGKVVSRFGAALLSPVQSVAYYRWYSYPFGRSPVTTPDKYEELWNESKAIKYPEVERFEENKEIAIDNIWFEELALQTQVVVKDSKLCYQHGKLLYSELHSFLTKNGHEDINILETGTARGFSSLCMAKALLDAGVHGKIFTFDVLPHDTKMYWNCISDREGPKTRGELLKNYSQLMERYLVYIQGDTTIELQKFSVPRVHFAFLDGQHTYEQVLGEFEFLKGRQKAGDIVFFDDYSPNMFPGVVKAVDEICLSEGYDKKTIALSDQRGYAIICKE